MDKKTMDKKTIIICVLIIISGFLLYNSFINRSELKSEKNINDVLIKDYNAKLDAKETKLIADSTKHHNKIDSLYNQIKLLNEEHKLDRARFQKELAKLKRINFVSDYNAYNDSLFNFIRTNGH